MVSANYTQNLPFIPLNYAHFKFIEEHKLSDISDIKVNKLFREIIEKFGSFPEIFSLRSCPYTKIMSLYVQ